MKIRINLQISFSIDQEIQKTVLAKILSEEIYVRQTLPKLWVGV